MRIAEYTINVGGYDPDRNFGMDCISDIDVFKNNARNARLPKILAHKYVKADFSIYWDANQTKRDGITKEIIIRDILGDADMLITTSKKTIKQEIEAAKGRVNDDVELWRLQLQGDYYAKKGLSNLLACGFQPLVRRHSPMMSRFNEAWWAEICKWSYRDQVSFPVIARMFPDLKYKEVELGDIGKKLYSHGRKTYPKIWK